MSLPTSIRIDDPYSSFVCAGLCFTEEDTGRKQARFRGRRLLKPKIDLSDYRFRAEIDFIDVRVFTNRTQVQWIQKVLRSFLTRNSKIWPQKAGAGDVADDFIIRFQEPGSVTKVSEIVAAIGAEKGERQPPQIHELEVSLDVYSRCGSEDARNMMVGLLQRTYFASLNRWRNGMDQPRSVTGVPDGFSSQVVSSYLAPKMGDDRHKALTVRPEPDEFRSPFVDGTMYLGERNSSGMIRIQNKTRDKQNPETGSFEQLSLRQQRARVEVTIKQSDLDALKLRNLTDLKAFRFTKLQKRYFQFMLPTFRDPKQAPGSAIQAVWGHEERKRAEIFLKSGVLALMKRDEVWAEHKKDQASEVRRVLREKELKMPPTRVGLGPTSTYLSYTDLSKQVEIALRHLSERESRAWSSFDGAYRKA